MIITGLIGLLLFQGSTCPVYANGQQREALEALFRIDHGFFA
jgi:hypothetical protein